ncbi:hypothetical protein [Nocardia colli]|uniref:hypothetical protein n=1 Tax=Nocardia colli TaxID=2545717 RepID=UPI0035E06532
MTKRQSEYWRSYIPLGAWNRLFAGADRDLIERLPVCWRGYVPFGAWNRLLAGADRT